MTKKNWNPVVPGNVITTEMLDIAWHRDLMYWECVERGYIPPLRKRLWWALGNCYRIIKRELKGGYWKCDS